MQNQIIKALKVIPVSELDRDGWLKVGMALKHEGYDVSVWDDWSQDDTRYHDGECQRLWDSFKGNDTPVTGGTIVMLAKQYGWSEYDPTEEIGWDGVISYDGGEVESEPASTTALSVDVMPDMSPVEQIKTYLQTLFRPDEHVAYVTSDTWLGEDGKYVPGAGYYDRTAGELIESLDKHPDDIGYTFGDAKEQAGAWIMVNPCDGKGVKQSNITAYRYALLECDEIPKDEQIRLFKESQIPIDIMVDSGGKSIHALVHVDAMSAMEYEARVKTTYDYCKSHGIPVDEQNKNSNRKSRLPGFPRNGSMQRIVSLHTGRQSWVEWVKYVQGNKEEYEDGYPDFDFLADYSGRPVQTEAVIDGVLRRGHKMIIAGGSKAGKSMLLMELAVSLAEGIPWLGFEVKKSRVLYLNLEIDKSSCMARLYDIYEAHGLKPDPTRRIAMWNLKGKAKPLNELLPAILKRAKKRGFDVIILDPMYKIITGDENSATAMAEFTNYIDVICSETGCSVIYAHHHTKGAQGAKKSMDRASGSGVFARDADALLDMTDLELSDELKSKIPEDEQRAYRIESTLREFKDIDPVNVWYRYPLHVLDEEGVLTDLSPAGTPQSAKPLFDKGKTADQADDEFRTAYDVLNMDGNVSVTDIAEYLGLKEKTVYDRRKKLEGEFKINNGIVTRVS